ncbi:MAG: hypothetical protein WAW41_15945, partial [Methylobacter sp.]
MKSQESYSKVTLTVILALTFLLPLTSQPAERETSKSGIAFHQDCSFAWGNAPGCNFEILDSRKVRDDSPPSMPHTEVSNTETPVSNAPEGGRFRRVPDDARRQTSGLLRLISGKNEHMLHSIPLPSSGSIGKPYVKQGTASLTAKSSGADTTTAFEPTRHEVGTSDHQEPTNHKPWYVSATSSITDHGNSGTPGQIDNGSVADICEYLDSAGIEAEVRFSGNSGYNFQRSYSFPSRIMIYPQLG